MINLGSIHLRICFAIKSLIVLPFLDGKKEYAFFDCGIQGQGILEDEEKLLLDFHILQDYVMRT